VFANARRTNAIAMRIVGDLTGADAIMNETLFVGTFPGMREDMCGFIASTIAGLFPRQSATARSR